MGEPVGNLQEEIENTNLKKNWYLTLESRTNWVDASPDSLYGSIILSVIPVYGNFKSNSLKMKQKHRRVGFRVMGLNSGQNRRVT